MIGSGEMPLIEYTVKEAQGMRLDQQALPGVFSQGGCGFDIHLSKVKYKPEEEKLFTSTLRSVRIVSGAATP